ncbi:MAG: uracil-DNA glycosylase [Pseudomonadota bacterium]
MAEDRLKLEASWKQLLGEEFEQPYMKQLGAYLRDEKRAGKVIFPPGAEMFAALDHTPVERVKVVIIGQDPYHGPRQAHGLCFSVRTGVQLPPSLVNIFKEIEAEYPEGDRRFDGNRGCLEPWARQGVLLLNAVLSVERGRAGSHQGRGWETFTDAVVDHLNREREGLVFLLWGSYAQKKGAQVDRSRHQVLTSPHPSPLSAHRGFFGCGHFRAANEYLVQQGLTPIDWFDVA